MTQAKQRTVGVVLRPDSTNALEALVEVAEVLPKGTRILAEAKGFHANPKASEVPGVEMVPSESFEKQVDLIIVLGGDGTLIHASSLVLNKEIPIVGINLGHIGFLTEIARSELARGIKLAMEHKLPRSNRMRLDAELSRNGEVIYTTRVLNDVVLGPASRSRIASIKVTYGGNLVTHIRGDGVIVSTPTGSTAYALAAGGSIVSPDLAAISITPVCPLQLTHRPLVLSPDDEITLEVFGGSKVFATFDGQDGRSFEEGDILRLVRAPVDTILLLSPWRDYFTVLRTKLDWGVGSN